MTLDLDQFTQFSRTNPKQTYTSVMGLLHRPLGLFESFRRIAANKAPGVDGVRKADYVADVELRLDALSSQLRRGGYKPQPVRRVYIPKASGGRRPLGIPAFEDRIVQDRASQILQAIWEPEFLDCSYGFRPGRSAHDALRRVDQIIMQERTHWIVEADIKGFFNHVSHDWLVQFLEHRIADKRFVRTLQRFLKGGVMEDGVVSACEEGTPQGGLVSPVLSNIYLHYVLDVWFERRFARHCSGKAHLVRYCDDFVAFFEHESDARRFRDALDDRFAKFNLEVEPSKTQLLNFGLRTGVGHRRDRPRTFDFLGFTHFIRHSRKGRPILSLKTARKRFSKKLQEVGQRFRNMRNQGTHAILRYAAQHVLGHIQYYGVSGNWRSLNSYVWYIRFQLFKWLNRRSQRPSCTWPKFSLLLESYQFPRARIVHRIWTAQL
ncbi:MAG: group II intron reverse transcriptase/maturase [Myxococcota bacterium]